MSVKGVVVLARNGDRKECYQDPKTYKYGTTESTPLGEVSFPVLRNLRILTRVSTGPSSSTRTTDPSNLPQPIFTEPDCQDQV